MYYKWYNSYSHAINDCNVFRRQVQSAINEGRLKFAESPQMKLDKDPFSVNMNMVEVDGKKVLVWPSQAESTKSKEVVIGEERPPRMIKPKKLKRWPMAEERRKQATAAPKGHLRHPYGHVQGRQGRHQRSRKLDYPEYQIGQSGFPKSGQRFYNKELI
jgi:hypothetical protein